ncbi:FT-interacting protein 3-like [Impatiens glandulifera]|uniref:FT-interacting protein 3-like n=1 Tax=Impatiens glandulifera TaxID=253017 RepID=UPI001FB0B1A6|nr:FT-interacting protein 3-like [Impatiens glandulifera]
MQPLAYVPRKISPKTQASKIGFTYDLVDKMYFLFVRVVKARELEGKDVPGGCNPYVEVRLGNFTGSTLHYNNNSNPEWNQVFAFEKFQASQVEVVVKDKNSIADVSIGRVRFDLAEVPTCIPPDSPLAAQWYNLEDKKGYKIKKGLIMLAVWKGTQADESFPDAWHSGAITVPNEEALVRIRAKVYVMPKLWYLRVNVMECQDLESSDKNRVPIACVSVNLGNQMLKTRMSTGVNSVWNEEFMFVIAEPFDETLVFIVEDRVSPNKDEFLAKCAIPVKTIAKRNDDKNITPKWYELERPRLADEIDKKVNKFACRIQLRMSLEGGYHVMDESTYYISDTRPSARALCKSPIGLLELGIVKAVGLPEMKTRDGKGCTDAFCVAKYGPKWVRTRTIIENLSPIWNEQYTWEVYDPCTVLTIGVFDNRHMNGDGNDSRIGKVRIRLSTLLTDRVYTHSYPLIVLSPSGVKRMGEIELAVRFTCTSFVNMMQKYMQPLLPKMNYLLSDFHKNVREMLRRQAILIVATKLGRAEPPLKKEVVDYMLDTNTKLWSLRRAKANYQRLQDATSALNSIGIWLNKISQWKNPITTILFHILFLMLVFNPELILPTLFFYLFITAVWRFRFRPKDPAHMDVQLSLAHIQFTEDGFDEEFDSFPTTKSSEVVRKRYDALRDIAGRVQTITGELANQLERFNSMLSWRDPRASTLFAIFCLVTAIIFYVVPFRALVLIGGFYYLRHPKLRHKLHSFPINYFKRLPAKDDYML